MRREEQKALDQGITLFNERKYFEAHEEWEGEWRLMTESDERTFFQGLMMAAGSFLNYVQHECRGAKHRRLGASAHDRRCVLSNSAAFELAKEVVKLGPAAAPPQKPLVCTGRHRFFP